ncbi:hypothetical protein [Rufibacter sp. LB8]|uniref:hypothetical protein n=1 Tax=Rufibacter sp. LB8 TaxID=2777781 RepID=UPI00178C2A91|nr:hypothetical protein [Rufibacter sp. LB8]
MTLKEKSQLVEVIGTHLQGKFTAAQINSLLKRYRISFDKQTMVRNKKLYATGIIGPQSDDVIIKIAKYLKLDIPEEYKTKPKQPKAPTKSPVKSARLQKSVFRQITGKKVFISHTSADKDIVEKVIDLLKGAYTAERRGVK